MRRGIPAELHRCSRALTPTFDAGEMLYRRIPQTLEDLAAGVSFDRADSSVVRSTLCAPDHARWDTEGGVYHEHDGVIQFPANTYTGEQWQTQEKVPQVFSVEVFHDPTQCNYAHCDFHFFRDAIELERVTAKSVRLQIRDHLRPLLERVL